MTDLQISPSKLLIFEPKAATFTIRFYFLLGRTFIIIGSSPLIVHYFMPSLKDISYYIYIYIQGCVLVCWCFPLLAGYAFFCRTWSFPFSN